jgi:DNA (cytosine-5)-methyltransferase 1
VNEIKPQVFIFENVTGLLSHDDGKTWEIVKQVFEDLDYDIKYDVLDAKDYGIPQLRRRLFVIGIRKDIPHLEYAFPEKIKLEKKATDYLDATVDNKYYLSNKGFAYVTQKKRHEGRARVNREAKRRQTANQQFNWTGDFRIESPKVEHINDAKIHKGVLDGEQVVARKLTPAECLRLMGFQDFKTVVVDEQIYRQAGNSICVPVLKEILKQINNSVRIF